MPATARAWILPALTAAVAAGLSLAAAELLLPRFGYPPFEPLQRRPGEPVLHEPEPELGWRNRPGSHRVPAFDGGRDLRVTFLEDRSRATSSGPPSDLPRIVLLGDSFTQGWAVGDADTFAWRLQERLPGYRFVNHGTAGYGTYQSLRLLEALRPEETQATAAVVYGFLEPHADRNVAAEAYLAGALQEAERGYAGVPFAELDDAGELVRRAPIRHPSWPGRERLATIAFAERMAARWSARRRTSQRVEVTERLVVSLRDRARSLRSRFVLAFLWGSTEARSHWTTFCETHAIAFADCALALTPELQVPGDGHPNARAHAHYATCLAEALPRILSAD